jgi:predicted glutamine amidotransferase
VHPIAGRNGGCHSRRVSQWLAWHGQPLLIEQLLFNVRGGLIEQSRQDAAGGKTTDVGLGLGWYGTGEDPGVYHCAASPSEDAELKDLAQRVRSPLFLAHLGPASGRAVTQQGRWLFVHDGAIAGFEDIRQDLIRAIDPSVAAAAGGSTDSEVLFALAVAFGLTEDPVAGLERAIGLVEGVAERHGIGSAVQASIGVTDGESLWAVRYCTRGPARPLFASADVQAARMLYPNRPLIQQLSDDDHIVVSEPLADLPGAWDKLSESSAVVIHAGRSERLMFRPDHGWVAGQPVGR